MFGSLNLADGKERAILTGGTEEVAGASGLVYLEELECKNGLLVGAGLRANEPLSRNGNERESSQYRLVRFFVAARRGEMERIRGWWRESHRACFVTPLNGGESRRGMGETSERNRHFRSGVNWLTDS